MGRSGLGRQRQGKVTGFVGPYASDAETCTLQLSGDLADPELRGDLHPDLLTAGQVEDQVCAWNGDALRHLGPKSQVHPLHLCVPERDVGEAVDVEVGAQL